MGQALIGWVIFALVTAGAFMVAVNRANPSNSADWSALIQAVGSIAAIVAAGLIAGQQQRAAVSSEVRIAARRRAEMLGLVVALGDFIRAEIGTVFKKLDIPIGRDGDWSTAELLLLELAIHVKAVHSVGFRDLTSYHSVTRFMELRAALDETVHQLKRLDGIRGSLGLQRVHFQPFDASFAAFVKALDALRLEMRDEYEAAGTSDHDLRGKSR